MSGIRGRSGLACAVVIRLCGTTPNVGGGQVVTPRTVPVQQSGQFDIFPSQRAGMAVSIALDDTLLDPFVNPAKRCGCARQFSSAASARTRCPRAAAVVARCP